MHSMETATKKGTPVATLKGPPLLVSVSFDEAGLACLAGGYAGPDGRTIELRPTDGRLVLQFPNGLRSLVLARRDDEFFTAAASLTFAAEQD